MTPHFPNRHPHVYTAYSYYADGDKTIHAERGWLNCAEGDSLHQAAGANLHLSEGANLHLSEGGIQLLMFSWLHINRQSMSQLKKRVDKTD